MVWLCCERNTRIMLILVLCLALWNLSNSAVIETVLLSKRSFTDKEWQRDPTLPTSTPSTFDLTKFTLKPEDRDDTPTPPHFDWDGFTMKPFEWDRSTYSPDNYRYNQPDVIVKVVMFFPVFVVAVVAILCKYLICNGKNNCNGEDNSNLHLPARRVTSPTTNVQFSSQNDTRTTQNSRNYLSFTASDGNSNVTDSFSYRSTDSFSFVCNDERNSNSEISRRTQHPPPRRVISPPNNVQVSSQNATRTTQSARRELSTSASNVNSSVTDSANRSNPTDKPPGYSDVVLADLSGQQNHFPEVKPAIPETPPPLYDDKNMRY